MRERPSALVVTTPGVVRFVGIGKSASAIPDYEIEAIDRLVASGLNLSPQAFMTSGQRIVVTAGPLQGLTGVLISVGKRHRLIVSVDLLMRSISAEVDIHDVEIEKTDGTLRPPSYHATITDLRPKH
jgi:transcription antitermination factor NusG